MSSSTSYSAGQKCKDCEDDSEGSNSLSPDREEGEIQEEEDPPAPPTKTGKGKTKATPKNKGKDKVSSKKARLIQSDKEDEEDRPPRFSALTCSNQLQAHTLFWDNVREEELPKLLNELVALEIQVELGSVTHNKNLKIVLAISDLLMFADLNWQREELLAIWEGLGHFNPLCTVDTPQ